MRLGLIIVIAACTALLAGCGDDEGAAAQESVGRVVLIERWVPRTDGADPIEGFAQFVGLARPGEEGILVTLVKSGAVKQDLPAGTYAVQSFSRTCVANCGHLEASTHTCATEIDVEPGRTTRIRVVTQAGETCELEVEKD